jgi:hypothetical protein
MLWKIILAVLCLLLVALVMWSAWEAKKWIIPEYNEDEDQRL